MVTPFYLILVRDGAVKAGGSQRGKTTLPGSLAVFLGRFTFFQHQSTPHCPTGLSSTGCFGLDSSAATGHQSPMLIYKIFRADEWSALQSQGETLGAPIDLSDGFIHFSTATQAAETAAKHFANVDGLFLLAVKAESLGETLKWEVSRGGADFPHLYRKLLLSEVLWSKPLPLVNGVHQFPKDMA